LCARTEVDHLLPDALQCQGAELAGHGVGVEPFEGPKGALDATEFTGGLTVLHIVALCMAPVVRRQFADGHVRRPGAAVRGRESAVVREPFTDKTLVFDFAVCAPPETEIEVLVVECDNGLTGSLVAAV